MGPIGLSNIILGPVGPLKAPRGYESIVQLCVSQGGRAPKSLKYNKNINNSIRGIVLSGGPLNVYEIKKYSFDKKILENKIPVLGICFGHQILSKLNGGRVKQSKYREFGLANIRKKRESILIKNFFNKKNINKMTLNYI